MGNEMKTNQVMDLLKEAAKVAKDVLKSNEPLVVVGIAQMLADAQRREKKVLPGLPSRPDPVQEARKTPRKPLMARSGTKTTPAKKTPRKR